MTNDYQWWFFLKTIIPGSSIAYTREKKSNQIVVARQTFYEYLIVLEKTKIALCRFGVPICIYYVISNVISNFIRIRNWHSSIM